MIFDPQPPMSAQELREVLPHLNGLELNRAIRCALLDPTSTEEELAALQAELELRNAHVERATFN